MTELERHEDIARRAADQAIDRVFKLLFGVDLEEQAQINDFRADLEHMRRMRKLSERVGFTIVAVVVGTVVTGFITLIVQGFTKIFGGHTG
jgi:hypothetical protein